MVSISNHICIGGPSSRQVGFVGKGWINCVKR